MSVRDGACTLKSDAEKLRRFGPTLTFTKLDPAGQGWRGPAASAGYMRPWPAPRRPQVGRTKPAPAAGLGPPQRENVSSGGR